MNQSKKRTVFVIVSIVLLVVMAISVGGRNRITFVENAIGGIITPIQNGVTQVGNFFVEKTEPIVNLWKYQEENIALTEENQNLKKELVNLTVTQKELNELRQLKEMLNSTDSLRVNNQVTANVIGKDAGNWYNLFMIDAGLDNGISKNSTIINADGLVGLVYEVGDSWAKAISIVDQQSSISFEILDVDRDFDGILSGNNNQFLSGKLFDPEADVRVGDTIITSGIGLYPKGIIIGKITKVIDDENTLLKEVYVEPSVNFRNINKVIVLPYENEEGQGF